MTRLEFYIEGVWLAPVDPPPAFREPHEAWANPGWNATMPILFWHPTLGDIKCAPIQYPARLAT
jgi:hypothetical protein